MSTAITSHDLFRIKLAQFKRELEEHAPDPHTEAGRQAPRQWQWYLEGDFRNFLRTMHEKSLGDGERADVYTRENYVQFSQMVYHIHVNVPHLLGNLGQWQYLVTELHCRVLEREVLERTHAGHDVGAKLRALLCHMQV
jgi:hypothetical protein